MQKKVIVISLGGSLIIPEEIDLKLLENLKKILLKHKKNYKFVIITGGGPVARKYISALKQAGKSNYLQSLAGIAVTRLNARFLSYFFTQDPNKGIPHDMKNIKNLLKKNDIVFCGALRYEANNTSDGTAAKLARFIKSDFINLTNVKGLYDKNPAKFKSAKFIPQISWQDFDKMANKSKFQPGQHFVLDQSASKIILQNKITTYILGNNLKNLDNLLSNKKFTGTTIRN